MFDVWMRVLQKIEGSVLWLLKDNPAAAANLALEAQRRGVAPERIVFAPRIAPEAHLSRMQLADLFLDTLPCNAHTTASEALWAGLPVLTCSGKSFAARVAGSLLHAAGIPELITSSLEPYEAAALSLAREQSTLANIRGRLQANRHTCALFDTDRFRRHIEAAYAIMWERYQQGLPPASFAVQPA
jgi:protein O-GlcNAc transferase